MLLARILAPALGFFTLLMGEGAVAGKPAGAAEPKKVESTLKLIAHVETIHVNIDQGALVPWVKPVLEVLEARFAIETQPRTVVLEVVLHPDRPAEAIVTATPALDEAGTRAILDAVDLARSPRSKVLDAILQIVTKVNGGAPERPRPLAPVLPTLGTRNLARFESASLSEKLALLQKWARTEAIPLLGEFARRRDRPEHQATRDFGKLLGKVKRDGPLDVAALTEKNPIYWRALIEAPSGDQLVPAAWLSLYAADGRIDFARRIADAIEPFSGGAFGSSELLREFRWRVRLFERDLEASVQKGIALNDQGKFDEALQIFDAVLENDPRSAWAHYERFQTEITRKLKAKSPLALDWPAARQAILEADPLYEAMASAETPDEVYDLLLRRELETLFSNEHNKTDDTFRCAEIALELGQPGFAAVLFWNAKRSIDPRAYGDRNPAEDALYCLEQLGIKEVKASFPGDHRAEFKRIDAERAKRKLERTPIPPPAGNGGSWPP
jgi:tetratricopeptide (TPR) repeat protein